MIFKNKTTYEEFTKDLKTGDLILYDTRFWYSRLIEYFSDSIYSHVALVIKKPTWLSPNLLEPLA